MVKEFLSWKVKPIWKIIFPSSEISATPSPAIEIHGVDRGSLDISHNWAKVHSVERFNQGFVDQPTDFRITIAVKEQGEGFETLRRLSLGGKMFDIQCDILRKTDGGIEGDITNEYDETIFDYVPWMKGYEKYIGCVVQREGQTVDIGAFPIREFEIEFLERIIQKTAISGEFNTLNDIREGDGTYNTLSELGI